MEPGLGRCPELDETFPYMLPGWSAENVGANYTKISPHIAAEHLRAGKQQLIQGEGSPARISSELQPQDPSGGVRLTAPWADRFVLSVETYDRRSGCEQHILFLPTTGSC